MILHSDQKGNDYMKITMSLHSNLAFRYLQCMQPMGLENFSVLFVLY